MRRISLAILAAICIIALGILGRRLESPAYVSVTIPPGFRKEQDAEILAQALKWDPSQEAAFMATPSDPDYLEGVFYPDTYFIPKNEDPATTADRMIADFNEHFASSSQEALAKNIKWTTALTVASIIQREAASSSDMALISGILWNRLDKNMPLQVDSTVQYARDSASTTQDVDWWEPLKATDLSIDSPFNTYINTGLPPHPIDSPGLDAIEAAINPATTSCLYYIHDDNRQIHCSATYAGQQANIQKYLK